MFPTNYKQLINSTITKEEYSICPIRFVDQSVIMKWRNEQMHHLRQPAPLTYESQSIYFSTVIAKIFEEKQPKQFLFSYLKGDHCIGYGGLVHINWIDKHAEISFVMDTTLENQHFEEHWCRYLSMIEQIAFQELHLLKIFTFAFNIRPRLYTALLSSGFSEDARLKNHCIVNGKIEDVLIHSKITTNFFFLRRATIEDSEMLFNWANDPITRQNSFDPKPILFENHKSWFQNKLTSNDSFIYLFTQNGKSVGQIRLDKIGEFWEIDYTISPEHRGKRLGLKLIQKILFEHPEFQFRAYVKSENIASLKIFSTLMFTRINNIDSMNVIFEKL